MIIISNEQGLITVDNWESVTQLPGYVAKLDHETNPLEAIRGRYQMKPEVNCGLKSCNQPHERGYVVTTKTGLTTNIGQYCGRNHFGVDFLKLARQFDRDIDEKEMREQLTSFSFRIEELEDKLNEMRRGEKGADWIHRYAVLLQTPGKTVPDRVIRTLRNMLRNSSSTLMLERQATTSEIESLRATGQRVSSPHFVEEPVGNIEGIHALAPESDLRVLLVIQIEQPLQDFIPQNIDVLTYEQLKRWTKWTSSVESIIDRANTSIEEGRRLLAIENLEQFNRVLQNADEFKLFRRFITSLKEG